MTAKELKKILDAHDDRLELAIIALAGREGHRDSHAILLRQPGEGQQGHGTKCVAIVEDSRLHPWAAGRREELQALDAIREDIAAMKDAVRVYARELARIAITPGDQEAIDEINQHLLDEGLEVFNLT